MTDPQAQQVASTIIGTFAVFGIISLAILIFTVFMVWRIVSKTGYSGAWSLLMFVPLGNLIGLIVLAFSDWPVNRELRALRQRAGFPPDRPSNVDAVPVGYPPAGPGYPPSGPGYPPSGPQYPQG